jgi:hypothetical protein
MFGSVFNIMSDVIDVVKAPVEVVLDVTRAVTAPIAEVANDIVKEVKESTK